MTAIKTPITVQPRCGGPTGLAWLDRHALWVLLTITVAGGILRFLWMDYPTLWLDEALTYSRVTGTFRQLLDILQYDGFPPYLYELYWWIEKGFSPLTSSPILLTPKVMRAVPALFGTAMVPVMYYLTRQLFNRRVALAAALVVACSAYLMRYSRDCKMYSQVWLFAALNIACLLAWLSGGRRIAWLAWIATGLAGAGFHIAAILLLPIQPLILLAHRRQHWKSVPLMLVGMLVILAGPAGYYGPFNRWSQITGGGILPEVSQEEPRPTTAPSPPRPADPAGRVDLNPGGIGWIDGYQRGRSPLNMVLMCVSDYFVSFDWPSERMMTQQIGTGLKRGDLAPVIPRWIMAAAALSLSMVAAMCVLGLFPWRQSGGIERPPVPGAFAAMCLTAWVVVPTYGFFYLRSYPDFDSPWVFVQPVLDLWAGRWWWVAAAMVLLTAGLIFMRPKATTLALSLAILAGGGLVGVLLVLPDSRVSGSSLVMHGDLQTGILKWILAAGLVVVTPLCVVLSGRVMWRAPLRMLGVLLAAGAVLGLCAVVWMYFDGVRLMYKLRILADDPQAPWLSRWREEWRSIWMQRYMGIVLPGLIVAAVALVMRLPTRPLRWLAIGLIIVPNIANGIAHLVAGTDPPYDRIAADIKAGQDDADGTRTYCGGSIVERFSSTMEARYYLANANAIRPVPAEFRPPSNAVLRPSPGFVQSGRFNIRRDGGPRAIADDIARSASAGQRVDRIILWQQSGSAAMPDPPDAAADPVLSALGSTWARRSVDDFAVRFYYRWWTRECFRRIEYVRE